MRYRDVGSSGMSSRRDWIRRLERRREYPVEMFHT
jgi:hypothetical protein